MCRSIQKSIKTDISSLRDEVLETAELTRRNEQGITFFSSLLIAR